MHVDEDVVKVQPVCCVAGLLVGGEDCDIFFWDYRGETVHVLVLRLLDCTLIRGRNVLDRAG